MRLSVVLCVKLPDTPVMVTVDVPVVAVPLAVSVKMLVVVVGFGANPAVTPLGKPAALKVTLPAKPLTGTTVMVLVPLLPCAMLNEPGLAVRLKSGVPPPAQPGKLNVPMAVLQSNPPFCFWYSSVNQGAVIGRIDGDRRVVTPTIHTADLRSQAGQKRNFRFQRAQRVGRNATGINQRRILTAGRARTAEAYRDVLVLIHGESRHPSPLRVRSKGSRLE